MREVSGNTLALTKPRQILVFEVNGGERRVRGVQAGPSHYREAAITGGHEMAEAYCEDSGELSGSLNLRHLSCL